MNIYRYLLFIYLLSLTSVSFSAPTENSAKPIITEILATPEFSTYREKANIHYIGKRAERKKSTDEREFLSNFFSIATIAVFFEWLLWIVIAVGVGMFVFYNRYWLDQWRDNIRQVPEFTEISEQRTRLPEKDDALPNNLAEQAWQLWQAGKQVSALSLLYRGALAILSSRDKLAVHASATEGECVRLVKRQQSVELSRYFSKLTDAWQKTAYSHRLPTTQEVQQLCEQWNDYFATTTHSHNNLFIVKS